MAYGSYSPQIMYVKKEDVVEFVKKQAKTSGIVLISLPLLFFFIQFLVFFILSRYLVIKSFPTGVVFEIIIFLVSIIFGYKTLSTPIDVASLQKKLEIYKSGEMINVKDLKPWLASGNNTIFVILILLLAVGMGWGIFSLVESFL